MSAVAVLLIALGCADIVRRLTVRTWAAAATGALVTLGMAALCGLWHLGDVVLVSIAAVSVVAWEMTCAQDQRPKGQGQRRNRHRRRHRIHLVGSFASWIVALGGLALAQ